MLQVNKIHWTEEELKVAGNTTFILTKHAVIRKVSDQFGVLERELKAIIGNYDLSHTKANVSAGKIFRGENYRLFPYVLLDFPRTFNTSTVFAFRSMFWWGHEFSFTLHLQGEALELFREKILLNIEKLKNNGVWICVSETPWQYHFERTNYCPLEEFDTQALERVIRDKNFLKLSRKLPVEEFDSIPEKGVETMKLFFQLF